MRKVLSSREFRVLAILVVEVVLVTLLLGFREDRFGRSRSPFLNVSNLANQARNMAPIGIAAVGAAIVIISGGIDLSCGSVLGLASVLAAWLLKVQGVSPWLAVSAAVGMGALCGFVNGALVGWCRIPPFIATLGMLSIARGVAFGISGGSPIQPLPDSFTALGENVLGVPIPFLIMLGIGFVGWGYLRYLRTGRYVFAIGGNEQAARFSGIRVARVKVLIYTLAGLTSGLAGVMWAARFGLGASTTGRGYELQIIAAVVVGGASLAGGRGSAWGALAGTAILTVLTNALTISLIPEQALEIAVGAVIVAAGLIDSFGQAEFWNRLARWWIPPPGPARIQQETDHA